MIVSNLPVSKPPVSNLQADVPDVLKHINAKKAEHVAVQKQLVSMSALDQLAKEQTAPRGFLNALRQREAEGRFALIAELKKASPSKGLIRPDFEPVGLARAYEAGGATCLSVLTDTPFFQGQDQYLRDVRPAVSIPCLRKDFMIDTYQVTEARAMGADCILIIMASLDNVLAAEIEAAAMELGMDALLEVHNEDELERALTHLKSDLLGVNNRDLTRLSTDLGTTERLSKMVPEGRLMVSESGLFKHEDLQRMSKVGANSFLIGESLMRHENVAEATRTILGETT